MTDGQGEALLVGMEGRPAAILYHDVDIAERVRIDVWVCGDHEAIAQHCLEVHTGLVNQGRCRVWTSFAQQVQLSYYDKTKLPWPCDDVMLEAVQLALHVLGYRYVRITGMDNDRLIVREWHRFAALPNMRALLRKSLILDDVPALGWLME